MIKYIGMYLLLSLLHFGLAVGMVLWTGVKLRWNREDSNEAFDKMMELKIGLYEETNNSIARAYREVMEGFDGKDWFVQYLLAAIAWPMGVAENLAILPTYTKYVNWLKENPS